MTKAEFARRLENACEAVISAEAELTEIDSRFGDADHGLTMTKVARAIAQAVEGSDGGIRSMLDDAAMAVMTLNGGSAVPLWNTWLDGMQEEAPEGGEIDAVGLKTIFAKALEELDDMSGAKVGDKTMMDAVIPASTATITLKEICNDRKKFGDEVQSKAQTDMNALGIQIISCNIQRVTDENSLINSLGQDNMSKIQKDAAIAKAEAERDIAIAQAQAAKASNDAQVEADMHIAQKQNDLAIKQSELKVQEDTKKAEADAAYTIQQQEQQRSIETATVNAQIAKAEREAELKSREVEVKKQSLDAEVRAAADADRYKKEQEAQAALYQRQKEAEAVRYEQEQAAEAAKKAAEAARFAREQEAAGIAAVGQAEAEAIRAKALAEAEGIDKKAEAMKKYGEGAIIELVMNALPEIAKNVAEPLSKVDKITMYGEGNSAKLLGDIINGTTQVTEGITAGMGIDIRSLIAGAVGGKLAAGEPSPVQVTVAPQASSCDAGKNAAAASAPVPEQPV